jgi:diacylglycerol kinase (ATP)
MKIAIVTNTLAGSGKAVQVAHKVYKFLSAKNIEARIFTEKIWDKSLYIFDQVWIVGGDGTLNYFVNQFNDIKVPLGIFNGGTGNDFYALLYGKRTLEKQVDYLLHAAHKPVDAGKCNDRYFLNGVGIGFEGAAAKSLRGVNKFGGKAFFFMSILKHIFSYKEQRYNLVSKEKTMRDRYLMISVANGTRYGGGFYVAPLAKPDDGLLNVNMVKPLSILKRFQYLPVIEKGNHLCSSYNEHFTTRKINIDSTQIMQAHLDGEYMEAHELTIEILPGHFNFIY